MTHREIFTSIYQRKVWGDGSGGGSGPGVAGPWAAIASRVIAELAPATVLDVGCGDGWASAGIELGGAKYIGVDPVEAMHRYCFAVHRRATRSFRCLDAISDELPDADLVLVKEVTQHLSDASVRALVEKLRRYPAVLHCSALAPGDKVAVDGGYRPVILCGSDLDLHTDWIERFEYGGTAYQAELWRPS
jgi:SAM-dependent methyltransferase